MRAAIAVPRSLWLLGATALLGPAFAYASRDPISLDEAWCSNPAYELKRGCRCHAGHLIETDGTARYSDGSCYPPDAHTFAQAVITHLRLAFLDPALADRAAHIAARAVRLFQRSAGAMGYQINRRYAIRIPYIRWSLAWMQRALVQLQFQMAIGEGKCKRQAISV